MGFQGYQTWAQIVRSSEFNVLNNVYTVLYREFCISDGEENAIELFNDHLLRQKDPLKRLLEREV